VPGIGTFPVTLINAGIPTIFLNAADIGYQGTELQEHINNDEQALAEDTALIPMKRWGREEEMAALAIDFRLRIAVALAVALTLGLSRRCGLLERWPEWPVLAFLGRISYALFLVHFPVCLLANALFVRLGLNAPGAALAFMALAWAA